MVRAGTLDVVEAERVCWAGREGAGAGREGAERPPRCLYLLIWTNDWEYRHVCDGLSEMEWMSRKCLMIERVSGRGSKINEHQKISRNLNRAQGKIWTICFESTQV